jgi:hypothetical protein
VPGKVPREVHQANQSSLFMLGHVVTVDDLSPPKRQLVSSFAQNDD